MLGSFLGICVQDRMIIPEINSWASVPVSYPPCFEFAICRMKRGGIKEMMISHIFQTTLVWPVPPTPECWHWCLYISFPLHWTFHSWSSKEAPENILRNAQSFLLTHPRGVSPVWCWAGGRQFTLCGTSSFPLAFQVGSSRMMVMHLVHSAHTPEHKGAPIMGVMRKSQFQWRTCECPVCGFFMR